MPIVCGTIILPRGIPYGNKTFQISDKYPEKDKAPFGINCSR